MSKYSYFLELEAIRAPPKGTPAHPVSPKVALGTVRYAVTAEMPGVFEYKVKILQSGDRYLAAY